MRNEYPHCSECDGYHAPGFHVVCGKPTVSVVYTVRDGVSLTDTVRKAEDAVSILGALYIVDCLISGSDQNGWNVTVSAVSR